MGGLLDQEVRPREDRDVGNDFRGRQGLQDYCQRRPSELDGIAGSARIVLAGRRATRMSGSGAWLRPATSNSGGFRMDDRKFGNPASVKGMHTRSC